MRWGALVMDGHRLQGDRSLSKAKKCQVQVRRICVSKWWRGRSSIHPKVALTLQPREPFNLKVPTELKTLFDEQIPTEEATYFCRGHLWCGLCGHHWGRLCRPLGRRLDESMSDCWSDGLKVNANCFPIDDLMHSLETTCSQRTNRFRFSRRFWRWRRMTRKEYCGRSAGTERECQISTNDKCPERRKSLEIVGNRWESWEIVINTH